MDATMLIADVRHTPAAREDRRRLGLWMFLATVTMLFAAFTSAYVVRRSGSDWESIALPSVLWWNTGLLVASSAALEAVAWHGSRRRWRAAELSFVLAMLLGAAFVAGQVMAWQSLVRSGVYLPANPFASFFYMMTGAHAVHVIAGLAVLAWGAALTLKGAWRRDPRRWAADVGLCRTFWHFLDAVWLYLFVLISVY